MMAAHRITAPEKRELGANRWILKAFAAIKKTKKSRN